MTETVKFTHEYPPIPTRDHDWRAGFDGREEEGRDGWGATKVAAAIDLYHQCETIDDTLACIVAILLANAPEGEVNDFYRAGYERAIRTVEGLL